MDMADSKDAALACPGLLLLLLLLALKCSLQSNLACQPGDGRRLLVLGVGCWVLAMDESQE